MADLLAYLAGDCKIWERKLAWQTRCGAYFVDLEWPLRPPDLPTEGERRLRLIASAKKDEG